MNDLCRCMPRRAMSAAIERLSSARRCWSDENRLNRVLSPFCGQQKISRPSATSELARKRPKQRRFFVAGYAVTLSGLLPLAPHPPPYKTGFRGLRENLSTSFYGYLFNHQLFFKS